MEVAFLIKKAPKKSPKIIAFFALKRTARDCSRARWSLTDQDFDARIFEFEAAKLKAGDLIGALEVQASSFEAEHSPSGLHRADAPELEDVKAVLVPDGDFPAQL